MLFTFGFALTRFILTIRFLLFLVFFVIGASAMVLSILAEPELTTFYYNRAVVAQIEAQNEKIQDLTAQYAAQVRLIESEPNILQRFSATTFGHLPQAAEAALPETGNGVLRDETDRILYRDAALQPAETTPAWLAHILQPQIRLALFLTGGGLVLITFIFFGSTPGKDAESPSATGGRR